MEELEARRAAIDSEILDDQAWLENRRIMGILRDLEQHAVAVRGTEPEGVFMEVDDFAPELALPMERPLFSPPHVVRIADGVVVDGHENVSADALFTQFHVDKDRLLENVRRALQGRNQVSLAELLESRPLEQGLAELVTYLTIASEDARAVIDDSVTQSVGWTDPVRGVRTAAIPCIVFTRGGRPS